MSKHSRLLMGLYLLTVTALLFAAFHDWGYDDPYITYRYARNLASGSGFVYNLGQRVLSTTTPLFALILAGAARLPGGASILPQIANGIGALSLAAGALALWRLGLTWRQPLVGWSALLLYPSFPLLITTLGSETPLYLALCLGAIAAYTERRYAWAAAIAALAVLARPDGALVVFLLAAHYILFIRRPIPWRAVAIFLALLLPWVVFATRYFGSPLPVTLAAKQSQGAMTSGQPFISGLLSLAQGYLAHWPFLLQTILAAGGLVYLIDGARRRSLKCSTLLLAWVGAYGLAYVLLGVSSYFWYYAPLVPGWVVLVGFGLASVLALVRRTTSKRKLRQTAFLVAGGLLVGLSLAQALVLADLQAQPDPRLALYPQVGGWLSEHTPPSTQVAAMEVGIIGYYAERPMIDFAGLIQPDVAAQFGPQTDYAEAAVWALQRYQPQYLVLYANAFPVLQAGLIQEDCQQLQQFTSSGPASASQKMIVYHCNWQQ